uniref:ARM repeat superfamily protein n=1 Tax=Kalanchoe fedtschenkoi TaxID=63787 RepID=A0A7N0U9K3_KALFE
MENGSNAAKEWTIHMQVSELKKLKETSSGPTIFAPQSSSIQKRESSNSDSVSPTRTAACAPEKKLTIFALRLAVLEKTATGLGTLGFIWATVVLLGGFAITLDKKDFWLVTIILLIEGTRIFSRSHELEWQHQATWSVADAGISSFRVLVTTSRSFIENLKLISKPFSALRNRSQKNGYIASDRKDVIRDGYVNDQRTPSRTWTNSDVPLLPFAPWVFISRNISKLLYWLQLLSATACIVLSMMRLIKHNYGDVQKGDTDRRNRKAALTMFYSLALAEAMLFLLEKAYWEWNVIYCELLEKVNRECELGSTGMVSIRRFFYDSYSRCVNGSIFDGLKMDMVTFAMDLLASNSPDEQLIGARLLRQFATNELFSDATLQKIGISIQVIERLVEMLNWKDPQEEEVRRSAAEILSRVASKKQNSLRVAGIPGAMESISSLLQTNRNSTISADEISEKKVLFDRDNYSFWTFNHLGLLILKKLSRDHDNCGKIGNTRGLLPKIIDFTHADEKLLKDPTVTPSQILTVKRSLQLVKMLASTTGTSGKHLRKEISEIVFTISNIRDILRFGERQPILQKLGIEILTSLALEEDATEKIGRTGGVLKELFILLFRHDSQPNQNHVRIAAGEALGMLALDSKANCQRILKLGVLENLVKALQVPLLRISAARILRNLCVYAGKESYNSLRGITAAAPTVLKAILSEENKLQEVMVGLAVHIFKFMNVEDSRDMFQGAGITEADLAYTLVCILKKHQHPPARVPRIRRFAIDLAISMMRQKEETIRLFRELGMKDELHSVLETTAEIENFNIFSGTVGLSRHSTTIHSLVDTALKLLQEK